VLLDRIERQNPNLLEAAFSLHQSGAIPAATHVLDLDAIAANTRMMAAEARRLGLRVYAMTKQDGHNPYVGAIALEQGFDGLVAVEAIQAHVLHRLGQRLGHVGHLSNIPRHQIEQILSYEPDVITVHTVDAARRISDAAVAVGRVQDLYVRVNRVGDAQFAGMVGGWAIDECVEAIRPILPLPGVRLAGLTTHPVIAYSGGRATDAEPLDNFFTMMRAKELLESAYGIMGLRVNCAANCNTRTFSTLASHGATDMEPGGAIAGSTFFEDLLEIPAQVYVSEVMHEWDGQVYTLGGGLSFIFSPDDTPPRCIVGTSVEDAQGRYMELVQRGVIDYFGVNTPPGGPRPRVGDTAVYAIGGPQMYVTRCYVAAVTGIADRQPVLAGLFDCAANELDHRFQPVGIAETRRRVADVVADRYAARSLA
jgi:predicted amino acid racemase